MGPAEVPRALLAEEVAGRDRSAPATRRARASFPTGKTFSAWDERLSSIPAPTQAALRTLEWISRHENLVVCGPSGTGKTFLLEALGQAAVEAGKHVAWFTLEQLGVIVRAHRADDSVTRAITRIPRADLVVVDELMPKTLAAATVDRLMHHAQCARPPATASACPRHWPGKECCPSAANHQKPVWWPPPGISGGHQRQISGPSPGSSRCPLTLRWRSS